MSKPAYPIPAVGAFVMRTDQAGQPTILLIQRAREPRKGEWSIPGGKIEWGEPLTDALTREVMEETGLSVTIGDHLLNTQMRYGPHGPNDGHDDPNPDYHYVLIDYLCYDADQSMPAPIAGDGVAASRFLRRNEALAMVNWSETRDAIALAFDRYTDQREKNKTD